jgi:hypothetical protein
MARTGQVEGYTATRVNATTTSVLASGPVILGGVLFCGTATGAVQFFAGTTCSASLTPVISFCGTTSAVAGGFSPMFMRFPCEVSGNGLTYDPSGTLDPNLIIFWSPAVRP